MTREEAIENLKWLLECSYVDSFEDAENEALDMAIKALEREKVGHWIKKDYWKPLPFDTEPLDWDNYDEETHSEKISLWYCSECDAVKGEIQPTARFCENCGTRMESEE